MLTLDEDFEIKLPSKYSNEFNSADYNLTKILLEPSETDGSKIAVSDPEYEQFLADVWVGIVLTLMVLSCVCFMCSCLIYHKFQQWKTRGSRESSPIPSFGSDLENAFSSDDSVFDKDYQPPSDNLSDLETIIEARNAGNVESGLTESELPSYTIASGLPTYEEALQLNTKDPMPDKTSETTDWTPHTPPTPATPPVSLNVVKFFQGYTNDNADSSKAT